jgi:hypothetical protein
MICMAPYRRCRLVAGGGLADGAGRLYSVKGVCCFGDPPKLT